MIVLDDGVFVVFPQPITNVVNLSTTSFITIVNLNAIEVDIVIQGGVVEVGICLIILELLLLAWNCCCCSYKSYC